MHKLQEAVWGEELQPPASSIMLIPVQKKLDIKGV